MFDQKKKKKLEQEAIDLGNNRKRLKTRLQSAIGALDRKLAPRFKNAVYDFDRKQLVSQCGGYVLQWMVREREHDQQTRLGVVVYRSTVASHAVLARLGGDSSILDKIIHRIQHDSIVDIKGNPVD